MIPIFRAKTIKQDYNEWEECQELKKIDGTWYAIGFYDCKREVKTYLGDWETTHLILIRKSTAISEVNTAEIIDISTLSIHFPGMIDSQVNKIFASLQEDGKGGDILEFSSNYFGDYTTVLYFKNHRLITHSKTIKENTIRNKESLSSSKVIGIQQ